MKQIKYTAGFTSIAGVKWSVKIWQDSLSAITSREVALGASPLVIEWNEVDKLEPVQSSCATLTLYADNDREFIDLYSVDIGAIRMDVYRGKSLYWSGTLDPELYEEPYVYNANYEVPVTFSDLAILDRINWNETGFITMRQLITKSLELSGVNNKGITEYISTKMFNEHWSEALLDGCTLVNDNFYDEDGEPLTVREVLEGVLRPFALHIVQKNGMFVVYDLNRVSSLPPTVIHWEGSDVTLGVDKTYNNVKVTFSPYEQTDLLTGEVDIESVTAGKVFKMVVPIDNSLPGFDIRYSDIGKGVIKEALTKFFKITPFFSGSECAGIAHTLSYWRNSDSKRIDLVRPPSSIIGSDLLSIERPAYIGTVGKSEFKLRICIDLLFDTRSNPFEPHDYKEGGQPNCKGAFNRMMNWCNYGYIPIMLLLRDASGKIIYHYENKQVKDSNGCNTLLSKWVSGNAKWGDAWLAYYKGGEKESRENDTGFGGWQKNKPVIGEYRQSLPDSIIKLGDGEFIPFPPTSGWLEIKVGAGVEQYDYEKEQKNIYAEVLWILYKDLTVSVVDKYGKSIKTKDIEHTTWINRSAKEGIDIETIVGTLEEKSPIARGQIFWNLDKSIISTFFRGGHTDKLERLLIGTVYSNYNARHTTLSGTALLNPLFSIYKENNTPGVFIALGETQSLQSDESEIKIVEFSEDTFEGVEFK